jgi:flagellar biosynthesis/type III secretory pathway protein FliH
MAVVTRGRILRGSTTARVLAAAAASKSDGARRVAKPVVDASISARHITDEARREAENVLLRARAGAAEEIERAKDEARDEEVAKLAAGFLALRAREEQKLESDLDRVVALAVMLAERLVSGAVESDPARILVMAQASLAEARGARRAVIEAHPLDAETLTTNIEKLGLPREALEIRPNSELARGELCLHTDLGTLDARLTPQLERLAAALRDALRT